MLLLGQRAEEKIDRHTKAVSFYRLGQMQRAVFERQELIRWNRVNAVRLDDQVIYGLSNFHCSAAGQNRRHVALVLRIQMLDHHESQSVVCRHRLEKFFQRPHPAGRCPKADYFNISSHDLSESNRATAKQQERFQGHYRVSVFDKEAIRRAIHRVA